MIVRRIALNGWRNYEFAAAEFSPGTNVITGENAQGKTNLLEAVYLLTGGKSFRTRFDRELIGFGYTSAEVLADVYAFGREQTVRVVLRQGQRKQIWQNGVKKTAAELAGNFAAVLFCPDDLNIIRDGPAARRRMMDMAISQLRPKYGALLAEYSRLYDQKSAILRDWHEKPSLLDTLDDFSDQMCRVSAKLIRYRAAYASRLNIAAAPIHADFSGGRDALALAYRTVSTVTDALGTEKEIYYALCDHQEQHRRAELDSGQCLTGAHKDDLIIDINGQPARAFASQGQTRTAALSLKLAEREIFHDEFDEYPVLMLDDVLSEAGRRSSPAARTRASPNAPAAACSRCKTGGSADVSAPRQSGHRAAKERPRRVRHGHRHLVAPHARDAGKMGTGRSGGKRRRRRAAQGVRALLARQRADLLSVTAQHRNTI